MLHPIQLAHGDDVEAAFGGMLIDTLSSIAQALDFDVVVFFRRQNK